MNFELTALPIADIDGDLEVIIVVDGKLKHRFVQDKKLLKKAGFSSAQDETCLLVGKNRLYVGASSLKGADIRRAAANVMKAILGTKYKSIKVATYTNKGCTYTLRAMVEGFILGAYRFESYKSKKNESKIKDITISLEEYSELTIDIEKASLLVHKGQITADATNFTRDIVNTTPDDCYPDVMASIS